MSRALTSAVKTETLAKTRQPVMFAFLDFQSGPVYLWTGFRPISFGGHTYVGTGYLGKASGFNETTDTGATGPTFSLSGVPSALIATVFGDNYNGRTVTAWIGMLDLATDALIADPYPIFSGRMDRLEIDEGPDSSTIRVFAESRLHAPNQADDRRFNLADQQIDFPSDTAFAYLASNANNPIAWGAAPTVTVAAGSGSGGQNQGGVTEL